MIRGTIEQISDDGVSGWLYADGANVRDRLVLAFLDDQCVGAGRVEHFRQDLADAGLGDGVLGFHFPIALASPADRPRVTVRLEGSDALLLHKDSRVVGEAGPAQASVAHRGHALSSLKWMLTQGWLDQSGYDFLKYLEQFGVYERSLLDAAAASKPLEDKEQDAASTAAQLLRLYYLDELSLRRHGATTPDDFSEMAGGITGINGIEPVVALWSKARMRIGVIEASHRNPVSREQSKKLAGGIDHEVGPDNLLFVNLRCTFAPRGPMPHGGVVVFYAAAAH